MTRPKPADSPSNQPDADKSIAQDTQVDEADAQSHDTVIVYDCDGSACLFAEAEN